MSWPTPQFSKSQINKAGQILISNDKNIENMIWAFDVLNNWRSCHGYPINTFQATLRQKLKTIDNNAIVAQRLKRMPSIVGKLWREKGMQLSRMQDIGGLRAVVSNLKDVYAVESEYRSSRFQHELVINQCKDYIKYPKSSGYRSVHLIYRYKNVRAPEYDGLLLELQIRSKLQHAWATAVETMGTFLNHPLKSSEGPEEWLKFFALASSAFAYLENTNPVPGFSHLTKEETFTAVVQRVRDLDVKNKLLAFTIAAEQVITDKKGGSYHLILLDTLNKNVTIKSFSQSSLEQASKEYSDAEKKINDGELLQAVLVSAGSIDNLRKAYPNYFLDTHEFVLQLNRVEKALVPRLARRKAVQ